MRCRKSAESVSGQRLSSRSRHCILAVAALVFSPVAHLAAGEISGEVGIEARLFASETPDVRQDDAGLSAFASIEYFHDWDEDEQRFVVTPFVRIDEDDDERSHFDLRELYWRKSFEQRSLDLYIGLRKIFWGVTESLHLVDVVNQTDLVEDIDGEDKLGQPMVQLSWLRKWGILDLFYLPYFRERTFPGEAGRFRTPWVVDTDDSRYESSAGRWHQDLAIRWSHTFGDWDLGLGHFYGTSRQPRLVPDHAGTEPVLIPHYDLLHQTSLDAQLTAQDWLWKLEAVARDGTGGGSSALVGGFEYTFYGVAGSAMDIGWVTEYQFDDRTGALTTLADNDLALGARLTWNDVADTNLLVVATVDLDTGSQFYSIEGDRRIGSSWEIQLQARIFVDASDGTDSIALFDQEDSLQVSVRWFF